jgi:hypothetical protein
MCFPARRDPLAPFSQSEASSRSRRTRQISTPSSSYFTGSFSFIICCKSRSRRAREYVRGGDIWGTHCEANGEITPQFPQIRSDGDHTNVPPSSPSVSGVSWRQIPISLIDPVPSEQFVVAPYHCCAPPSSGCAIPVSQPRTYSGQQGGATQSRGYQPLLRG